MKTADMDLVREMEVAVFDVTDWSEVLHMAAAGLADRAEAEAFQIIARSIRRVGEQLRQQWCLAAQVDEGRRPCA